MELVGDVGVGGGDDGGGEMRSCPTCLQTYFYGLEDGSHHEDRLRIQSLQKLHQQRDGRSRINKVTASDPHLLRSNSRAVAPAAHIEAVPTFIRHFSPRYAPRRRYCSGSDLSTMPVASCHFVNSRPPVTLVQKLERLKKIFVVVCFVKKS